MRFLDIFASKERKASALMMKILTFVDRNGDVETRTSNPSMSALSMSYEDKNIKIKMHITSFAQGNGSCGAMVTYNGEKVYSASGCFTDEPWNMNVKMYEKGPWEKLIENHDE